MPYDSNNRPQFNAADIIASMARTLEVMSYAAWCDLWDEADDHTDRPEDCVSAGPGEDWFNVAPELDAGDLEDYGVSWERDAAILYGRIWQAWGVDPWLVLVNNGIVSLDDARSWGHYAVMSALGHGVSWEDRHPALEWRGLAITSWQSDIDIETREWPGGEWPSC